MKLIKKESYEIWPERFTVKEAEELGLNLQNGSRKTFAVTSKEESVLIEDILENEGYEIKEGEGTLFPHWLANDRGSELYGVLEKLESISGIQVYSSSLAKFSEEKIKYSDYKKEIEKFLTTPIDEVPELEFISSGEDMDIFLLGYFPSLKKEDLRGEKISDTLLKLKIAYEFFSYPLDDYDSNAEYFILNEK